MTEESRVSHAINAPERLPWPIALTFIAGLLVSLCIFTVLKQWDLDNQRLSFESRARDYTYAIENDLGRISSVLEGIGDSVQVYGIKDRGQFKNLVRPVLRHHKSIQAISWNPIISNGQRPLLVSKARAEGLDYFQFSERNSNKDLVRASSRRNYIVVYFIEPLEPNQFALGYDIASNPTRKRAINQAFQSGKMVATERITLVQETDQQRGVLILIPIYKTKNPSKQEAQGLLVGVLRLGDVVTQALSRFEAAPSDVQLIDQSQDNAPQRLFSSSQKTTPHHADDCPDCFRSTFQFCQREWQLSFHPNRTQFESSVHWQSFLPAALCLLFSLSVCIYLFTRFKHIQTINQQNREQELLNKSLANEINERERAESLQREGEGYLKSLTDIVPIVAVFCQPNGQIKYVNNRFQSEFLKPLSEVVGWNFSDLFNPEVQKNIRPALTKVKLGEHSDFEFKLIPETETRYYAGTFVPQFTDSNFIGFITVINDVTKEKKIAANQLQSQKLEALGTLAGGIAHEFNNLLTIILGNAKLHMSSLPTGRSEARNYMESITAAGVRAKELGRQILTFSRREAVDRKVIDLSATIVSTLKILSATTPSHITTKTVLPQEQCPILAAPTQIQQVLLNLCTNAYHAIEKEKQGVITIECVKLREKTARLIVRDNGKGIPDDLQGQIFDPFFTTKKVGEGTGLGLSVVHGIVESHNGQIHLESTEGQGSTFTIDFALSTLPVASEKTAISTEAIATANQHILVVED